MKDVKMKANVHSCREHIRNNKNVQDRAKDIMKRTRRKRKSTTNMTLKEEKEEVKKAKRTDTRVASIEEVSDLNSCQIDYHNKQTQRH